MPEILTESFCERCGTRYTFESARPKVRLKGVKVLSRGLKNFVLSDDTTMDEAMAAARSETDRESTAHQLDAFHKTFSFCMSCRQYTCPNCWNEVEARCQSCAPLAMPEVSAATFPSLMTMADTTLLAEPAANGTNGKHDHEAPEAPAADVGVAAAAGSEVSGEPAAKAVDQTSGLLQRFRPGQSLDDELAAFERDRFSVEALTVEPASDDVRAVDAAVPSEEPIAASAEEMIETVAEPPVEPEPATALVAEAEGEPEPATVAAAEAEPEPEALVAAVAEIKTEPVLVEAAEPVAIADLEPEPEPGVAAELEPEPVAAAEAEPEPLAAAAAEPEPEPEPVASSSAADIVEQPTWRITAPEQESPPAGPPARDEPTPATGPSIPSAEPQWPAKPEWPAPQASAGLPFLGRPAQPRGGVESLWAASNRELVATPPIPGRSTSGIQPCVSCGLSLSANARFCRRCGTLQRS